MSIEEILVPKVSDTVMGKPKPMTMVDMARAQIELMREQMRLIKRIAKLEAELQGAKGE